MSATSILTSVKHHRGPYAAISPSRPELSQNGRVVVVTGAAEGIGYAIARSFGKAGAAKVIVTGRRKSALDEAVTSLTKSSPQTSFEGRVQDASDLAGILSFWKQLDEEGIVVDVLVLNVAAVSGSASILELGYQVVVDDLKTNASGIAAAAHCFYYQKKREATRKLSLINISTMSVHNFDIAAIKPNYSASKTAGTVLVQQIAQSLSPDDMQVNSFHPGAILTAAAKRAGFTEDTMPWDNEDLPGHYAVWAASDEAKFLHGRFTWAAWDVDELTSGPIREKINANSHYLKTGIVGV